MRQIWYRDYELADIKQEASALINAAKTKKSVSKDSTELRGLHMSKKKQRRQLWVMALTCVLDEQRNQAALGVSDPAKLARLYQSFTQLATKVAIKTGESDAEAAKREHLMS